MLIALLILVTLTKMIPLWGFIYTTRIYPVIGTLLSPISGFFPFAVGDIFIALSIAWVILYPIYEIGFRKSGGVSAVGVCLVLHRLGIELFTAEHLC